MNWARVAKRIRVPLGFVFAAIYLWLAKPTWVSLAVGAAVAAVGVGIRAAASGHVKKNEELATTGPYAYTRNPLYLGSTVIAVGFAVAALNLWIGVALVALYLGIYMPVIRGEEEYLLSHFPDFRAYTQRVPRLFPRVRAGVEGRFHFSRELYMQHREYNAILGTLIVLAALVTKLLWTSH